MSISDRLDEIEQRRAQANSSLMVRNMLTGKDVPDMLSALRAVLDLHPKSPGQRWVGFPRADRQEHYCIADQQAWPCDTHRAATAALGEES